MFTSIMFDAKQRIKRRLEKNGCIDKDDVTVLLKALGVYESMMDRVEMQCRRYEYKDVTRKNMLTVYECRSTIKETFRYAK